MHLGLGLGFGSCYKMCNPPFSPAYIANLVLWLDASDVATITQSVGAVSQWDDKSGNGYNASQSTTDRKPITGTRTINGKNVLDFDGSNDRMILPSGIYTFPAGENTAFAVGATDNASGTSANQRFISATTGTLSTRFQISYAPTTGSNVRNGTADVNQSFTIDTNAHILGEYRSGSTITPFYDGVAGTGGTASDQTPVDFTIGARVDDTTPSPFNGTIAEILLYARALTLAEINQIGRYLAQKWGTVWTDM